MSVEPPAFMSHLSVSVCADMAKAQGAAAGQPSGKAVAMHPPRATDAFYAKLLPALEVPVCLNISTACVTCLCTASVACGTSLVLVCLSKHKNITVIVLGGPEQVT